MIQKRNIIALLFLTSVSVFANKADNNKPYVVKANSVLMDSQQHITTYIGNVHATQGSTHLTANKVITYENKQNKITKLIAYGSPAKYDTLPDNQTKKLYASAEKIIYSPNDNLIHLRGNGFVTQSGRKLKGNKIDYNMDTELLYSAKHEKAQTTIIIPPTST